MDGKERGPIRRFSVICTAFVHAEGRRKMRKFLNRAKNTEKISVIKNQELTQKSKEYILSKVRKN